MQLDKAKVKTALFAASCSLLSGTATAEGWEFDTAVMYYGESDRVTAVEGIVNAKKTFKNQASLNSKLVVDSLTGASASGAVPQKGVQTYTTPSGNGQYEVAADGTPLDTSFKDTRVQAASQWAQPLGERYVYSGGFNVSSEYDYQSLALNSTLARYFNKKNTTLSLGLSYAFDNIEPVGGTPIGLSAMVVNGGQFADTQAYRAAFDATRDGDSESKDTVDLILGVTQVINKQWITQLNFSISQVDGYLTDPYKLVSVVDDSGTVQSNLYENRPDTRAKQALFAQSKYHFGRSVWDLSLRLADDDWGVQSQTLESRYRFLFSGGSYLEPHIRLYQQQEADFYQPFLDEGESTPEFASADYRIGKLNTYTLGLKYGKKLRKSGREFGVRIEYYNQAPQDVGKDKPGQLNDLDLYSSLDALILQLDYKF